MTMEKAEGHQATNSTDLGLKVTCYMNLIKAGSGPDKVPHTLTLTACLVVQIQKVHRWMERH